jgi:hypothetical protein
MLRASVDFPTLVNSTVWLQIIPQDDGFLEREPWDFRNTPREHYPLLLF